MTAPSPRRPHLSCRPRRYAATTACAAVAAVLAAGCGSTPRHLSLPLPARPTDAPTHAVAPPPPVYPLTGLPVRDRAVADRPALSIKIDNVAGAFPQSGLNQADIVVEALVEGGLTRLFVTFQSAGADPVGPIRSARPVDADLLRLYGPSVFVYAGAAAGEIAPVIARGEAVLIQPDTDGSLFYRDSGHASPHNLFSSTSVLWALGRQLDPRLGPPRQVFSYSTAPPAGPEVRMVTVPLSPISTAGWRWAGTGYVRYQNGAPDILSDGSVITATNVVIMSIAIGHTGIYDAAGNEDPLDIVLGSGPCWVLRDGRLVAGTWRRSNDAAPLRLTTAQGQVIALQPGRTWIELMQHPYRPQF